MKAVLFAATLVFLLPTTATAHIVCSPFDLIGNWDVYTDITRGGTFSFAETCSGTIDRAGRIHLGCAVQDEIPSFSFIDEVVPLTIDRECRIRGNLRRTDREGVTFDYEIALGTMDRPHSSFVIYAIEDPDRRELLKMHGIRR